MELLKFSRSFYLRPTLIVARDLLGKYLVRILDGEPLIGKIVEVEGYRGEDDPASHAYRGQTKRNEMMFYKGGHLYVYFTYGMHFCCNVVTEEEGKGRAALIRALEPISGIGTMQKNRHQPIEPNPRVTLTNGPAKLCQALGISGSQNGADLLGDEVFLAAGVEVARSQIVSAMRIGIKAGVDKKWRFYVKGNRFVSKISIISSE